MVDTKKPEQFYFGILAIIAIVGIVGLVVMFAGNRAMNTFSAPAETRSVSGEPTTLVGESFKGRFEDPGDDETIDKPEIISPTKMRMLENETCYDSDGGFEPFIAGFVEISYGQFGVVAYDTCLDDNYGYSRRVMEMVCNGTQLAEIEYKCPYNCFKGRCLNVSITEPVVRGQFYAYKWQHLENPSLDSVSASIRMEMREIATGGEYHLSINCNSGKESLASTDFFSSPLYPYYSNNFGGGTQSVWLENVKESDLRNVNCYGWWQYGPLWGYVQMISGGLTLPKIQQLIIMKELGSNDYYANFVGYNNRGIDYAGLSVGITDYYGNYEQLYYNFNYGSPYGVPSVNEMIPLNFSLNNTQRIDLILWLDDYEYEYYGDGYRASTGTSKEYVLGLIKPSGVVGVAGKQYSVFQGKPINTTTEQIQDLFIENLERKAKTNNTY
ncbi:MAG: hypothetical protein KKA51_02245 [Nanoarchaeota archaeon]|nr:hypothetical protein [Nanoarchaeota archaeon]